MKTPKKLLIIKTGNTLPSLAARRGDFEDWILAGMEINREEAIITDVPRGAELPDYSRVSGIIITGSHDMVTDRRDWSERAARWLPGAVEREIPLLGICYGHQLLAHALGGKVANNPNGAEYGTAEIHLTKDAGSDALFRGLPGSLKVQASHAQSVLSLPPGATLLASGARDPHQAFVVGKNAWGVQFHPEFDADITREYIRYDHRELQREGQDPDRLIESCEDNSLGRQLLRRFVELVREC